MTQDTPAALPAPASESVWLFKGLDGNWKHFLDEQHRRVTIESGNWEVREFQAATSAAGGATGEPDLHNAIVMDWATETDNPVAEMDAIMKVYEESMGIEPGPVMARAVEKTKAMLLSWWGWHRESIRAALAAQSPDGGAAPAEPCPAEIEKLLEALSQHDNPCEDVADAQRRVHALVNEVDRLTRAENAWIERMAYLDEQPTGAAK